MRPPVAARSPRAPPLLVSPVWAIGGPQRYRDGAVYLDQQATEEEEKRKEENWRFQVLEVDTALGFPVLWRETQNCNFGAMVKFYSENHEHVVCEHGKDRYTPVMSFLDGKQLLKSVDVPGKRSGTPGKKHENHQTKHQIKVTKEVTRRLLVGLLVLFRHLHSEGKTLNGSFTAANLFVPVYKKDQDVFIKPYIEVKLDSLPLDAFKPYTEDGGDKDLMVLGQIIENSIFSRETELPSDLAQLLELLRCEPMKNQNLIYDHVSLKGPRDTISYFMWLHKRLQFLKKKQRSKYDDIMAIIDDIWKKTEDPEYDWRDEALENKYLAKLRPYHRNGRGGYSEFVEGLSRFYRNAVEHLLKIFGDKSKPIPEAEKKEAHPAPAVGEEELEDYHIAIILKAAFPKFLGDLQKAFHEKGELQWFSVEDSSSLQNVSLES
ncbi:hypothetical protein ACP70R_038854 [Stipagrostis hirtigluma subsp. patula]